MGKGEGPRTEAEAHHLDSGPQADRGGATSTLGEVEAHGVNETRPEGRWPAAGPHPLSLCFCTLMHLELASEVLLGSNNIARERGWREELALASAA
jgi:hypothetical protein